MRARSGGHSYAGYSIIANGVVLDLRKLNAITINQPARYGDVGAGAQWSTSTRSSTAWASTLPAGPAPRSASRACRSGRLWPGVPALWPDLRQPAAAEIVTAEGQLRTVEHQTDGDLLWALKGGGGGNFGVVTQFTFKVHPVPANATYFDVSWPWSSADEAIAAWQGVGPACA